MRYYSLVNQPCQHEVPDEEITAGFLNALFDPGSVVLRRALENYLRLPRHQGGLGPCEVEDTERGRIEAAAIGVWSLLLENRAELRRLRKRARAGH